MPVSRLGKGREWELDRIKTICSYCGVGCQVEFAKKGEKVLYAQSTPDAPVNGEFLCTKGRYGWDFATNKARLTSPMIRKDIAFQLGLTDEAWALPAESPLEMEDPDIEDGFVPVDWETAYEYVADQLTAAVANYGPDSVMGLASARCTNEENYIFQKFFRAAIKTNNIDHCARL
jgi:predicted molibdopterin-dependent oxidoreductase YjgC